MNSSADNNLGVCVVGLGAATSVGQTAPASAAAVRAGIAGFADHPYIIDSEGDHIVVAMAPYLSEDIKFIDRLRQLALPAAQEALAPLASLTIGMQSIPLILGLPAPRPGLPTDLGNRLTEPLKCISHNGYQFSEIQLISSGHSAGLMALEAGLRRIEAGHSEFCLVGGVDSYLDSDTLEWLDDNEQLHKTINAYGFIPGEAAGFCLLCSKQAAERFGQKILAKVLAAATARETNLIKTETVCVGKGLTDVFKQVFSAIPSPELKIEQIICDMNGEPYRADEYGFASLRLSACFVDASDFQAPADCWGDVGAASGPLFLNLIAASVLRGYVKKELSLIWTSSEGGERTAALIRPDYQMRRAN